MRFFCTCYFLLISLLCSGQESNYVTLDKSLLNNVQSVYAILFDKETNTIVDGIVFEHFNSEEDVLKLDRKKNSLENLALGIIYKGKAGPINLDDWYQKITVSDEYVHGFILYEIDSLHITKLPNSGKPFQFRNPLTTNSDQVTLELSNVPHHFKRYYSEDFEYENYSFKKLLSERNTRIIKYKYERDCSIDLLYYSGKLEKFKQILIPCYEFGDERELSRDFGSFDSTFTVLNIKTILDPKDLDIRATSEFGDQLKVRDVQTHEESIKTFIFSDAYDADEISINARFVDVDYMDSRNQRNQRMYIHKLLPLSELITIPDFEFVNYEVEKIDHFFNLHSEIIISNWKLTLNLVPVKEDPEYYLIRRSFHLYCTDKISVAIPEFDSGILSSLFGVNDIRDGIPSEIEMQTEKEGWSIKYNEYARILER